MGLFKSLFKKGSASSSASQAEDFPELYNGMKAEVLTPANTLIFVGRLKPLSGETLEVRAEDGGLLPRALYNQPVKLRCFRRDGETFTLDGAVGPNGFDFWRIERLRYLHNSENRSFFRQNTGVDGTVSSTSSSKGQPYPCKLLDVSAGGARVVTEKLFQLESTFQLEAALLPGEEPFTITCRVKRVLVQSKPGSPVKKFEYGCQFEGLPPREQDRLLQAIFTLQRKALQSQREP